MIEGGVVIGEARPMSGPELGRRLSQIESSWNNLDAYHEAADYPDGPDAYYREKLLEHRDWARMPDSVDAEHFKLLIELELHWRRWLINIALMSAQGLEMGNQDPARYLEFTRRDLAEAEERLAEVRNADPDEAKAAYIEIRRSGGARPIAELLQEIDED